MKNPFHRKNTLINSPVDILASSDLQKNIAFFFGFGCLIFACTFVFLSIRELKKTEHVFAIDGAQTVHIGPLEINESSSSFFQNLCLLATQVALQRSPSGLDMIEFSTYLFSEPALKKIQSHLSGKIEELKYKNLHQKPEIKGLKIFQMKNGVRQFYISGSIISAGVLDSIPIVESEEFSIFIFVIRNPKINEQGMYPYIINDIQFNQ